MSLADVPSFERRARPGTALTEDGRRRREVVSYARRSGPMSTAHRQAWERNACRWWIPDQAVDAPGFALADWLRPGAPLVVEVGSGGGEATAALAVARPDHDVLGVEVWRPGVAETMLRLEQAGVQNVRLMSVDAAWVLEQLVPPGSVSELWTFFPDPWPKRRHRRRRLVDAVFAGLAASRLRAGGRWRLATDWPDYAAQMVRVLDAVPLLEGGVTVRWADRPITRFERRGVAQGRPATDLTYRRRG